MAVILAVSCFVRFLFVFFHRLGPLLSSAGTVRYMHLVAPPSIALHRVRLSPNYGILEVEGTSLGLRKWNSGGRTVGCDKLRFRP